MSQAIIAAVRYSVKPGKRDEFCQKIVENGIDTASRAENGCRKYDYYYPLDDENAVCLMEIWDSAEAQKAHTKTPHYQVLAGLKAEYTTDTKLMIYPIGE